MADDDFNWDEVLVTTKPDSKEVEVSFKRVDGGGFFQNESGPGTPPGTTEDPDGCRNTATLYSEDVFAFQSNQPHYVWLLLKHPPNEYMEVDIQFSDGDMTYPDYTTQSLTYVIQPGSWENDGNGWYGKKIALLTGDLSAKIDAGTDSGLYYAQITAVRNFGADSCFSPTTVTINFGPAPAEADPPPNEGGGGDPIDPTPDPACEPGIDCDSRYNRTETFEGNYDSVLFLHRPMWYTGAGAPSTFTRAWSADRTDIQQSGLYSDRDANQYQLRDKDDNIIFDGYAESIPPNLEGGASPFRAYINSGGYYTDRDNLCASPTNVGGRYEPNYFTLKEYKMNGTGGDEANCLNQSFTGVDFDSSFRRWSIYNNNKRIVSPWENSAYVPDPTNVPEELKNYNATFSDEHTQWLSVFTPGPWQESAVSSEPYRPITYAHGDPSYPSGPFIYAGGSPHFVHNGIFGGGTFSNPTPLSQGIIYFLGGGSDPYEIQFLYSRGGGGQQSKVSQIKLPAWGKGTGGWVTAKIESWYEIEWKADNTDGDFGLYDFGFVVKQQKFFTWFWNGIQVTPRHMVSDFNTPQDGSHDNDLNPEENLLNGSNYGDYNQYFRGGLPVDATSYVNATWVTRPLTWDINGDPNLNTAGSTYTPGPNWNGNIISSIGSASSHNCPMIAMVDHTAIANQFFETDQFKTLIKTFDKGTPDYCARRP